MTRLLKAALGTLAVFAASLVWLFISWSNGSQTYQWTPTPATVISNNVQKSLRGQPQGWRTTIKYEVDEIEYQADVDEYLIGDCIVHVNPDDPTSVVGKPGPTMQATGRPILVAVVSGLFGFTLLLIAISPRED